MPLSQERHRQVIFALTNLRERGLGCDEETKQLLVQEKELTDKALGFLGITAEALPRQIPYINQVFLPSQLRLIEPESVDICVGGMPCAGKSTLANNTLTQFPDLELVGQNWRELKKILDRRKEPLPEELGGWFATFERTKLLATVIEAELVRKRPNSYPAKMILDRETMDASIFLRSHLAFGRLNGDHFVNLLEQAVCNLKNTKRVGGENALILCLVSPETSLKREGKREKPGRVMWRPFLKTLYEQYLRFYAELLMKKNILSLPFVCLDTSGSFEESQARFNHALEEIFHFFNQPPGNLD